MYFVAQLCGLLGTVITVIQPQFRTKRQLSLCSGAINLFNGLNFLLLGQRDSSLLLCLVAVLQAGISVFQESTGHRPAAWESGIFGALYLAAGFLGLLTGGAVGFLELLPILGALMLLCSIQAQGQQRTRRFLLLNSLCWLIYTAAAGSTVFFSCLASLISSLVALWKYRKR